jgi:hypothetical protein
VGDEPREPRSVRPARPTSLLDGHTRMVSPDPVNRSWRAGTTGARLRGPNPQ